MEDNYLWIAIGTGIGVLGTMCVVLLILVIRTQPARAKPADDRRATSAEAKTQALDMRKTMILKERDGLDGVAGWLVPLGGANPLAMFVLDRSGDTTIGADLNCKIVLSDRYVSGTHCRILGRSGYFTIERMPSARNPVKLNGQALERSETLRDGSEIQIGETRLMFKCVEPQGSNL